MRQCPGTLFIVAAPSGGGKTSLVERLVCELNDITVSVSHTTRAKRPAEVHGVHYFFVDEAEFFCMVEANSFLEYAQVFDNHYGTSKTQIEAHIKAGVDVVLDIDWQGAQQIKHFFPEAVTLFILPPSMEALRLRLMSRKQDNPQVIEQRMQRARDELSHYNEFDYLIVNDDFDSALTDLKAVVVANRLKKPRQEWELRKLLSFLMTSQ